jgi:putative colanic acid biosynthesis UDP-glucose lipid carrier transferase
MALVGPRPHALAHDIHYAREIPSYRLRFQVKPGITGWAQVNGARGETPTLEHMQRRVELDLYYVQHRSLTLNLIILLRTLREIRDGHHAY